MLVSNQIDYIVELGRQCILMGKVKEGLRYFKNALRLDENNLSTLIGIAHCSILDGSDKIQEKLNAINSLNKSSSVKKVTIIKAG